MFPLWLKLAYSTFVAILIPVYWVHYGPANFLWFSDIALFGGLIALWTENKLLASMMVLLVLPEIVWNVDFFTRLMTGRSLIGLADYMFDQARPMYLRGLSLFHVFLPITLIWMVYRMGYDRRALVYQIIVTLIVFPVTYLVSPVDRNINWVYGLGEQRQQWMHPLLYLALLMIAFPVLMYLPVHLLLVKVLRW